MAYKIASKKLKTTATYNVGKFRVIANSVQKPLMTYEENGEKYYIKSIDFTKTTANSNWADVEFYNKEGKFTIDTNRIKGK